MLDVPLDAWYAWLGLAAASVAILGVATGLPTHPQPDADGVARTIDSVASSPHAAIAEHPLNAAEMRLSRRTVALRGPGEAARATFAYGPVVPVKRDSALFRVLTGTPPDRVFDSPQAFAAALDAVRDRPPAWQPAPNRLVVRRVRWEGTDVTLVG